MAINIKDCMILHKAYVKVKTVMTDTCEGTQCFTSTSLHLREKHTFYSSTFIWQVTLQIKICVFKIYDKTYDDSL